MTDSISSQVAESVRALKLTSKPRVGLVLGSGLGAFADTLESLNKVPYSEIPHFAVSRVVGHSGNLCFGKASGVDVVCMQGRVHSYEGHNANAVVHGVRTMARLGVEAILITNAAGGLDPSWTPGDLMMITDHLNLTGLSPLLGINDDALGVRFPDMSHAYDRDLQRGLLEVAEASKITLRKGVYAGLLGPSYETPAEIRMLRTLGAQAVGMSTVLETIALRHMRVRVGALSCITNLAAGILDQELNHAEVEETARARRNDLLTLLRGWITKAAQ
jgi:purine-nucleoside phosphorylase